MSNKFNDFIEYIAQIEVPPNVINQYNYTSSLNQIRRDNLLIYLNQMDKAQPRIMLIGEAPGYRGSRITGVPLTSEYILMKDTKLFGKKVGYKLPELKDKLIKEATATIIRETLSSLNIVFLAWNSFPFHPHKPGDLTTNRTPLKREIEMGKKPLLELIKLFDIQHVIAVGRKAEGSLKSLNIPAHYVRHPAQGGKNEFVKGMKRIKDDLSI